MSWSVGAIGKPEAVAKKLAAEFDNIKHLEGPEDLLKMRVADLVAVALAAYTGPEHSKMHEQKYAVQVTASGSGMAHGDHKTQTLSLEIKAVYGFCE